VATLPTVELLYFEGCPNYGAARASIERIAAEEDVKIDLRLVEVTSPEQAAREQAPGGQSALRGRALPPSTRRDG
jgi:hypothetical protein